jgi:hypothetical protein
MATQAQKNQLHHAALLLAAREDITYDDASGRVYATAALADGTQRSQHFETLLRLQARGITPKSPDFGKQYNVELATMQNERAEAERKLDAQLAAIRRKREASASTPAAAHRPLAPVTPIRKRRSSAELIEGLRAAMTLAMNNPGLVSTEAEAKNLEGTLLQYVQSCGVSADIVRSDVREFVGFCRSNSTHARTNAESYTFRVTRALEQSLGGGNEAA